MATEKRLDAEVDSCVETAKIKTHHVRIVVDGTAEKPYYSIEWFDPAKKEYYLGYSSYFIGNVFKWLEECFEIVDAPTVDAVEVVHGKWEIRPHLYRAFYPEYCCSACGGWKHKLAYEHEGMNYCPNCGAKMDGGNEDV
jgi:hypothetical protein